MAKRNLVEVGLSQSKKAKKKPAEESVPSGGGNAKDGRVLVGAWCYPEVREQLQDLAFHSKPKRLLGELYAEALNLLFQKYGKPQIAATWSQANGGKG